MVRSQSWLIKSTRCKLIIFFEMYWIKSYLNSAFNFTITRKTLRFFLLNLWGFRKKCWDFPKKNPKSPHFKLFVKIPPIFSSRFPSRPWSCLVSPRRSWTAPVCGRHASLVALAKASATRSWGKPWPGGCWWRDTSNWFDRIYNQSNYYRVSGCWWIVSDSLLGELVLEEIQFHSKGVIFCSEKGDYKATYWGAPLCRSSSV